MNWGTRTVICLVVPNFIYYFGVRFTKPFGDVKKIIKKIERIIIKRKDVA